MLLEAKECCFGCISRSLSTLCIAHALSLGYSLAHALVNSLCLAVSVSLSVSLRLPSVSLCG